MSQVWVTSVEPLASIGRLLIRLPVYAAVAIFPLSGLLSLVAQAATPDVFPATSKTQGIVVADLFGDLKRQLENKAHEMISQPSSAGASSVETVDPQVAQSPYPDQAQPTLPQAKQSKKKQVDQVSAGPALPQVPFIERDKEIDFFAGKWRLLSPFPLYAKEGGGQVLKTLPKGLKVDGLSLAVHTTSYAVAELKKPLSRQFSGDNFDQTTQQRELFTIPLQRGDKIVYLSYFGEGECRVWVKGHTYDSGCFDDDDELKPIAHYSGVVKTTHWALVRTPEGMKGWLWIKDSDFKSIQGISKHGESVD